MPTFTLPILGTYAGFPDGNGNFTLPTITLTSPNYQRLTQTLVTGANTVTIPSGVTLLVFVPPSANTSSITLKGISGDTGIPLNRALPSIVSIDTLTPPTTVTLTAGAGVAGFVIDMF